MGKLLLTNEEKWNIELKECYKENGCQENGYVEDKFFLTTYRKTNIETYNLYQQNGDFVATAGTVIYKDYVGEDALKGIFEALQQQTITELRRDLMGSYVVVYKKDDVIKAFVDETNTYAFYAYLDENRFLLTNTYYHIERCIRQAVDKQALVEYVMESCIIDEATPFEKIRRIQAEDCIALDLKSGNYTVEKIVLNEYKLQSSEPQQIVEELYQVILKYAIRQQKLSNQPVLFTTGGVDSRLMLASYLAAGITPKLASWKGSPVVMNTKIQDTEITKEIAEKMQLAYQIYDVSQNFMQDYQELSQAEFDDVGEYTLLYANNKKWMDMIRGNEAVELADFGYFGEILKGWDLLDDKYQSPMTLECYTDMYMGRARYIGQDEGMKHYSEYRRNIFKKLQNIAKKEQMDEQNLSREDCMLLYYHYRLHADTQRCSFVNQFCYSLILYGQKEIADLINQVSYELKKQEKLNLELVYKMEPRLLEIPYFSHCRFYNYDDRDHVLKEKLKNRIRIFCVGKIKKTKIGGMLARYKRSVGNSESVAVRKLCADEINSSATFRKLEMKFDEKTLAYLPKYLQFIYLLRMADCMLEDVSK